MSRGIVWMTDLNKHLPSLSKSPSSPALTSTLIRPLFSIYTNDRQEVALPTALGHLDPVSALKMCVLSIPQYYEATDPTCREALELTGSLDSSNRKIASA